MIDIFFDSLRVASIDVADKQAQCSIILLGSS
jgi:hypothetical protein